MATCITFGIQKGGVGKTTTAAISSWLLARKSRVLAVDMDSQGNLTQVLSRRPPESFAGRTVLEALKKGRPDTYIHGYFGRMARINLLGYDPYSQGRVRVYDPTVDDRQW